MKKLLHATPFAICIAFFAVAMVLAGRWQDRVGPRIVTITAEIDIGLRFVLK